VLPKKGIHKTNLDRLNWLITSRTSKMWLEACGDS